MFLLMPRQKKEKTTIIFLVSLGTLGPFSVIDSTQVERVSVALTTYLFFVSMCGSQKRYHANRKGRYLCLDENMVD